MNDENDEKNFAMDDVASYSSISLQDVLNKSQNKRLLKPQLSLLYQSLLKVNGKRSTLEIH